MKIRFSYLCLFSLFLFFSFRLLLPSATAAAALKMAADVRRLERPDWIRRPEIPQEFQPAQRDVQVGLEVQRQSVAVDRRRLAPERHGNGSEFRRHRKYRRSSTSAPVAPVAPFVPFARSCRRHRRRRPHVPHLWIESFDRWIAQRSTDGLWYVTIFFTVNWNY